MTDQDDIVKIYTDGSCLSNPGPGGWAWRAVDGSGTLEVADLGRRLAEAPARAVAAGEELPDALAELERIHIQRILTRVGGDRKQAAALLEIDVSTLYRKLKRWEGE